MRFMPAILAKVFKPVFLMDARPDTRPADPIAREIGTAVAEHERVASGVRDDYAANIRAMADELFRLLDKKDEARG